LSFKRAVSAHGVWSPDSKKVASFVDLPIPIRNRGRIDAQGSEPVNCHLRYRRENSKTIFEVKDDDSYHWIFCGWSRLIFNCVPNCIGDAIDCEIPFRRLASRTKAGYHPVVTSRNGIP
jgi:hypothetical protein